MNARAEVGGLYVGGVIGQAFVQFYFRRFAPSVVCCLFSVSAYFPLMDIDLDMPHAVPDDNDDDEGDDPFDELHNLGDGNEEEDNDDIVTLEQAIDAVEALQSTTDIAELAPDMAVPAADWL